MPAWTISILPRFEIRTEAGGIVSLRSRQYAEFLAILALAGPEGIELSSIGPEFFTEEWSDQKKAIRNIVSRTRKHLESYSLVELIRRENDFACLISGDCDCDLWRLRDELTRPTETANLDRIEQLLRTVKAPLLGGQFLSNLAGDLLGKYAEDLLQGLEVLAAQPNRPGLRTLAGSVLATIKPSIAFSTDLTHRQLALFGKLRMRQEIIETLADYSDFLSEDVGDSPDRLLVAFAETLLREIDRSEIDHFAIPKAPHAYLAGIGPAEELVEIVLAHRTVFVGGLPGVGKSQLLIESAGTERLKALKPAFLDLSEHSRPIAFATLASRDPGLIFVDHYTESEVETVQKIRDILPEVKLVVAGATDLHLEAEARMTVKPLSLPDPTSLGNAALLLKHLLHSRTFSEATIRRLAEASKGIPSAIVRLAGLSEHFGPELAVHTFCQEGGVGGDGVFGRGHLKQSIEALSDSSRSLLKGLVGLKHPVSTVTAAKCFRLTAGEMRLLISKGLIEMNRELDTFEVSLSLKDQLEALTGFSVGNSAQRQLEDCLHETLRNQQPSEANTGDIKALEFAINSRIALGDFQIALSMLRTLRPHMFRIRSCSVQLDGLDDQLYALDLAAGECIETLLAIGSGFFYCWRQPEALEMLEDSRWQLKLEQVNDSLRAEYYSQLGITKGIAGQKWEGIEALHTAAKIASKPGLEPILVKATYNLAATYYRVGEFDKSLECMGRAVDLLKFAPTVEGRSELLHMFADYSRSIGVDAALVEHRYQLAISYAKANRLKRDLGWIRTSLGTHLLRQKAHLPALVLLSSGLRDDTTIELNGEFRRRCSFTLDLIAHCVQALGSNDLAYQAALMAMNVFDDYFSRQEGLDEKGIVPIELPDGLKEASNPVSGGDILVFLSRIQQFVRKFPESQSVMQKYGYLEDDADADPTVE